MSSLLNFCITETVPDKVVQSIEKEEIKSNRRSIDQLFGRNFSFSVKPSQLNRNEVVETSSDRSLYLPPKFTTLSTVESEIPSSSAKLPAQTNVINAPQTAAMTEDTLLDTNEDFLSHTTTAHTSITASVDFQRSVRPTSTKSSTSLLDDLFGSIPTPSATSVGSFPFDLPATPSSFSLPDSTSFDQKNSVGSALHLTFQEQLLVSEKAGKIQKYDFHGQCLFRFEENHPPITTTTAKSPALSYPLSIAYRLNDPSSVLKQIQSNDFTFLSKRVEEPSSSYYQIEFQFESPLPSTTTSSAVEHYRYQFLESFKPALVKVKQRLQSSFTTTTNNNHNNSHNSSSNRTAPRLLLLIQLALNPHYSLPIQALKVQVSLLPLLQQKLAIETITFPSSPPTFPFLQQSYDSQKHILTFLHSEAVLPSSSSQRLLTYQAEVILDPERVDASQIERLLSSEGTERGGGGLSLPISVKGQYEDALLSGLTVEEEVEEERGGKRQSMQILVKKKTQLEFRFL